MELKRNYIFKVLNKFSHKNAVISQKIQRCLNCKLLFLKPSLLNFASQIFICYFLGKTAVYSAGNQIKKSFTFGIILQQVRKVCRISTLFVYYAIKALWCSFSSDKARDLCLVHKEVMSCDFWFTVIRIQRFFFLLLLLLRVLRCTWRIAVVLRL